MKNKTETTTETTTATTTEVPVTPVEAGFGGPTVCGIVGMTYRQLDYWTTTELVRASIADAKGSGTQRVYSYTDLVEIKVVKSLRDAGVSLQKARRAIEYLREHLGGDLASAHLVLDGARSILARSGEQIVDLLRSGQGVLNVVPLGHVVEELDAKILELAPRGGLDVADVAAPPDAASTASGG